MWTSWCGKLAANPDAIAVFVPQVKRSLAPIDHIDIVPADFECPAPWYVNAAPDQIGSASWSGHTGPALNGLVVTTSVPVHIRKVFRGDRHGCQQ
jgi:hypothetical protein